MTKISTYTLDEKITALDKWIGSDVNTQNRTKNFTPKKLAEYFNEDQVINIGVPLQYKYYTLDPLEARPNGTLTFETEIGPTVNFSSVTTFILSKYTTKQNIVSEYLNFLDGCKVLLFKASDINSFGFYRIVDIAIYDEDPNFYVVTVDYETGNGFMQEDKDYMISLVSLPGGAIPTKTSELINDGEDGVNPFISELDINREEWDAAYEGKINSAEVTGTTTKTLTLTKQNGSTIEASWTDDNTDAVTSVFGRTGDVVAESGDYTTDQVIEVTDKKYQTDLQDLYNDATSSIQDQLDSKQGSITLTTTGTSGAATLIGDTLNIPQYSIDLSGYVPYTGATQDVNLGLNQLKADSLAVSTTSTESIDIGEIVWNQIDGTFDMGLLNGVTLQNGQKLHIYGKALGVIADGDGVMFAGSQGDHLLLAKADQDIINVNPEYFIGVATQDFANNEFGYITILGKVRELNTLAYNQGDVLYFASQSTTHGALTATIPVAPYAKIVVAAVVRVHANQGILMVRPHIMPKINDIQDMYLPSPSNNEGIFWNSATLRYENNTIIGALGYTPYNATNPNNYISLLDLSSTATGLTYNNATGVFSITGGYVIPTTIEETNWNTAYNNRITSASSPLSIASNIISISQSGSSSDGYLSSGDWNIFNNKQAAGNYITDLIGEATASGPGSASVTLSNSAVTGKVLTGVNITGGTIVDTDSILTAFGKVQNQINGLISGSSYQGTWNASTNTPTIVSGVGSDGDYYIVSVSGTTNIDGISDWQVGDWIIFHGTTWQKVDNTDAVVSVNGFTGAVSLSTSDIAEGTNLYYTESRVSSNTDVSANTAARHDAVTLGTTNGLSLSGQQLSLSLASLLSNGALSSTDWNTFNNKQSTVTLTTTGNSGSATFVGGTLNIPTYTLAGLGGQPLLGGTGIVKSVSGTISYLTDNSSNWNDAYTYRLTSASSPLSLSGNALSISQAGTASDGYLSFTDWNTFNNKQNALTNPITGTGTINYVPRWTSGSAIGNSLIYDSGVSIIIGGTGSTGSKLHVVESSLTQGGMLLQITNSSNASDLLQMSASGTGNIINASNASSNIFKITNSGGAYFAGNVGIGTATPSYLLDIVGTANTFASIGTTGTSSGRALLFQDKKTTATKYNWLIGAQYNTDNAFEITPSTTVGGSTYSSPSITILQSGNVGIGTTAPSYLLDLLSSSPRLRVKDSSTGYSLLDLENGSGSFYVGNDNSTGSLFGGSAYAGTLYRSGAYPIAMWTNGSERMRITSGGNVGIGTTSPSRRVETTGGSGGGFAVVGNSGVTDVSSTGLGFNTGYSSSYITSKTSAGANANLYIEGNNIAFSGGGAERMRITSGGNVGIGTTSPAEKLDVFGKGFFKPLASSGAAPVVISGIGSPYYGTNITLASDSGTAQGAARMWSRYDGTGKAAITFETNSSTQSYGADPQLLSYSETMRISGSGDVGIGTTTLNSRFNVSSPYGNSTTINNTSGYSSVSFIVFQASSVTIGNISRVGTTNAVAYNTTSDYRLKEDLKSFNGLDLISKIKIYDYKWKNHTDRMNGVLAHELQEVVPYAVTGEKDAEQMQSVDYSKLVPILVQAIQELKAEIEILKTK